MNKLLISLVFTLTIYFTNADIYNYNNPSKPMREECYEEDAPYFLQIYYTACLAGADIVMQRPMKTEKEFFNTGYLKGCAKQDRPIRVEIACADLYQRYVFSYALHSAGRIRSK